MKLSETSGEVYEIIPLLKGDLRITFQFRKHVKLIDSSYVSRFIRIFFYLLFLAHFKIHFK